MYMSHGFFGLNDLYKGLWSMYDIGIMIADGIRPQLNGSFGPKGYVDAWECSVGFASRNIVLSSTRSSCTSKVRSSSNKTRIKCRECMLSLGVRGEFPNRGVHFGVRIFGGSCDLRSKLRAPNLCKFPNSGPGRGGGAAWIARASEDRNHVPSSKQVHTL